MNQENKKLLQELQINNEHLSLNLKYVEMVRTAMSVILGAFAGILGLEGISGFLLYILGSLPISLGLYLKTEGKPLSYFRSKWDIASNGIFGNLLSFVLFWT